MKYRRGIFCVVYRKEKNKILYSLLRRKLHWIGWEFPKGGLKRNEKVLDGIKREIKEETGQKAENIKGYKLNGKYNYDKQYKDRQGIIGQTWKLYSAEIKNKKIRLDKLEHSDYKWLDFEKAAKKLTWANQKKSLRVVNKKIK